MGPVGGCPKLLEKTVFTDLKCDFSPAATTFPQRSLEEKNCLFLNQSHLPQPNHAAVTSKPNCQHSIKASAKSQHPKALSGKKGKKGELLGFQGKTNP